VVVLTIAARLSGACRDWFGECLNQSLLINVNLTMDEADEWYFEAVVEVAKL